MRCLVPAAVTVEVDAREYHDPDGTADDELRSDYVVDGELDLDIWARDQVALSLPDQILCRADCAGLCPVCGRGPERRAARPRGGGRRLALGRPRGAPLGSGPT